MKKLLKLFKNKYFLAIVAFLVWITFFDKNDMISQYEYRTQLNKLTQEKEFYIQEISQARKDLKDLDSSATSAEKFAREKYFMKKNNEDIFVVTSEEGKN